MDEKFFYTGYVSALKIIRERQILLMWRYDDIEHYITLKHAKNHLVKIYEIKNLSSCNHRKA